MRADNRAENDDLPIGWNLYTVNECCEIVNNLRKPIDEVERKNMQGTYPYYGPTKIQDYIDSYAYEGKYALIGEDGDHFLKYAEWDMTLLVEGKFNVNNHAHVVKGTERCIAEWFALYFRHKSIQASLTRQGAKRYKLTKEALSKLPIIVPSRKSEQEKIWATISLWDNAIELKEKLLEQKKLQKKGLMERLLTGKARLPNFQDKWFELPLGVLLKERKEIGYSGLELLSITAQNGVVKRAEIDKVDTSSEDKSKYKRICPMDIGYNTMRMWQGVSGFSKYEGIVSPAYTVLKPTEKVDPYFMAYLFKLPKTINLFWRHSQGLVDDTLNIKYDSLKRIRVRIPSEIEEQKAIAEVLRSADGGVDILQNEITQLKTQKKGLMQLLLTGRVRVSC